MAETVATKAAFRDAFARGQRCIVPVDGFYEWKKTRMSKQPYAFVGADGLPLALAGLWAASMFSAEFLVPDIVSLPS